MFPHLRFPRLNPDERKFGAEVPVMRRHYTAEDVAEIVESAESDVYLLDDINFVRRAAKEKSGRLKSNERRNSS
jgi:hypothetical protein